MAHRYLPMYDLASAVGRNRPNLASDVKLIQAMISNLKQLGDPLLTDVTATPVTGQYTKELGEAILGIQKKACQSFGVRMALDGVVDPMPSKSQTEGDWDKTFQNGVISTMSMLNYRLFRNNPQRHLALADQLGLPWRPDPFQDL